MAYDGEIMTVCQVSEFDLGRAFAVVVSGAALNPCGHMLLNVGGTGGFYFHVTEVHGYPKYMTESGYKRYLTENKKVEISRSFVALRNPRGSLAKLEELLSKKWTWYVLPNNCARFVEEVLQAGGTKAGLYSNCPTLEGFR